MLFQPLFSPSLDTPDRRCGVVLRPQRFGLPAKVMVGFLLLLICLALNYIARLWVW